MKTAHVAKVSEDYIRVDIPNLDAHGHVYLYFPTLNWRLWESHPFSVIGHGTVELTPNLVGSKGATAGAPEKTALQASKEVTDKSSSGSLRIPGPKGTTLFIRLQTGTTMPLAAKAGLRSGVPVLVESSYGHQSALARLGGLPAPSSTYPNLIVIAGGVGITAALPIFNNAQSLYTPHGVKKLFWGVRAGSEGLVESVQTLIPSIKQADEVLSLQPGLNTTRWADIDVTISVGERLAIRNLLEAELSSESGSIVFVCGPAGLADETRAVVTALGRHGALVQYAEEAFAW